MDNLAHTLAGLALAEAGLRRRTALATATLAIGANLPDVDALAYAFGTPLDALVLRRGWTHGVLAMVLLPPLLAAAMLGWHRLRRRSGRGPATPVHAGWLLAVAAIGIWSHPLLDLLNTYGVRLLMPFSERWFYGDTLFIVDPWLWGALALGVLASQWRARRGAEAARAQRPARVALAALTAYVVAMVVAGRVSRAAIAAAIATASPGAAADPARTMAAPLPVTPFRRTVVREIGGGGAYETGEVTLAGGARYAPRDTLAVAPDPAIAFAAARTRDGAAFLRWSRFPVFESFPRDDDSVLVRIYDLRYDDGRGGWASVDVVVPRVRAFAAAR